MNTDAHRSKRRDYPRISAFICGYFVLRLAPRTSPIRTAGDADFARSLAGKKATVRVIFFDRGGGSFTVSAGGQKSERPLADSGRWQTAEYAIERAAFAEIQVSVNSDLTLHMIEVAR